MATTDVLDALCHQALEAANGSPDAVGGPRPLEMAARRHFAPRHRSAAGAYADAVRAYTRAAELRRLTGTPGLPSFFFAYSVQQRLLGGGDLNEARPPGRRASTIWHDDQAGPARS